MRTLLLFRGAPGCGKSTFIDNNGLRPYTLSADEIRLLCCSPKQTSYGSVEISQSKEKDVWTLLFKILKIRMMRGEFTVIDATNSKTVEMNRYKELCEKYKYRMFCIDMTDVPIDECKRRNAGRIPLKRVPEEVIDKMYSRFRTQKIPSGIKVIKPDELSNIFIKKFDMSDYDKIVHIGDIHGSYTALMEYFKDGFNDNYLYIFCGDLLDRGLENVEVLNFFIDAYKRKNVLILEGNHEKHLWCYGNDEISKSKEFELVTKKQLDEAKVNKKEIRQLYRKMGQCAWYTYWDKEVFVSHGGIATMPENLSFIATYQMIDGVGSYKDYEKIAETWLKTTSDNMYQIHGHRNVKESPIQINERVFNLEGLVEFGGCLRIVELDKNGFHTVEIKNTVFKDPTQFQKDSSIVDSPISDIVIQMRNNKYIQEKEFGNISSFNFTRDAFCKGHWDAQTITARGLYIYTKNMSVMCRGFSKFFNVNEVESTKFENLQHTLQFPVTCYVKENGFLGLVSYNPDTDDLFITTKSNPDGDYAQWLRDMVYSKISEDSIEKIKNICKKQNVTFVFECVDMKHDPHIIKYTNSELILLSIIRNDINFSQYEYDEVVNIANGLGIPVKTKAFEISTWAEFVDWYREVLEPDYEFEGKVIEGFVIEDSSGFMTKLKLTYYNFWKFMRNICHETLRRGYIQKTSALTNDVANDFYGYMKSVYANTSKEDIENLPKDICYWRDRFYNEYNAFSN